MVHGWVSRLFSTRNRRALPAVVALAFVLGGCGGDDAEPEDAAPTETPTAPAPATSPAASGTPTAGEDDRVAETGDTVTVHYRGTLDDGTEFDSSFGGDPMTFTIGNGDVIDGFDAAVQGMEVGETKEVRLTPEEAYGERTEERILQVPRDQAPEGLEAGQQVLLGQVPATVVDINDETVTLDANHQLAGQALTFEIELVAIR